MERKSRKIAMVIIGLAAVFAIVFAIIQVSTPNGATTSDREELIRENRDCSRMIIATEIQLENYLLCGIYDDNNSGIAIFELSGKDYKLQSITMKDKSRVLTASEYLNGEWYQLVWFNGADTQTAEVVIMNTDNNEVVMAQSYDVSNGNIIIFNEPDGLKNFSLNVVYYDAEGNAYE